VFENDLKLAVSSFGWGSLFARSTASFPFDCVRKEVFQSLCHNGLIELASGRSKGNRLWSFDLAVEGGSMEREAPDGSRGQSLTELLVILAGLLVIARPGDWIHFGLEIGNEWGVR
jgi:hypothetical protein